MTPDPEIIFINHRSCLQNAINVFRKEEILKLFFIPVPFITVNQITNSKINVNDVIAYQRSARIHASLIQESVQTLRDNPFPTILLRPVKRSRP